MENFSRRTLILGLNITADQNVSTSDGVFLEIPFIGKSISFLCIHKYEVDNNFRDIYQPFYCDFAHLSGQYQHHDGRRNPYHTLLSSGHNHIQRSIIFERPPSIR